MDISVNANNLVTNPKKCEMSREDAIQYAKDQLTKAMSVFKMEPTDIHVDMWTEGETRDPVQKVTMRVSYRIIDQPIVQSAHSRDIKKAIDRCIVPITRQIRKSKTKVIDKRRSQSVYAKEGAKVEMIADAQATTSTYDWEPDAPRWTM